MFRITFNEALLGLYSSSNFLDSLRVVYTVNLYLSLQIYKFYSILKSNLTISTSYLRIHTYMYFLFQ